MGIQFNRSGIGDVAPRAMANHRQRLRRLYEQAWRYGKEKTRARVGEYMRRWKIWRTYMTTVSVTGDRLVPQGVGTRRTVITGAGAPGLTLPQESLEGTGKLLRVECVGGGDGCVNHDADHTSYSQPSQIGHVATRWPKAFCYLLLWITIGLCTMHRAYADVPDCTYVWNGSGTIYIDPTVPWPAHDLAPGTQVGFVRNSGFSKTVTCHMPDGYDRMYYFNGMRLISGPGNGTLTGEPGVIRSLVNNITADFVTGSAVLSCTGKTTNLGTYPTTSLITSGTKGWYIAVPCENGPDGTVTATLTVSPMTLESTHEGDAIFVPDKGYVDSGINPACYLLGGCAGIGMSSRSDLANINDSSFMARMIFQTIYNPHGNSWGNWACTTDINDGGQLNWGVLSPPVDLSPTVGQILGAEKIVTVTVACPKDPNGTAWSITGGVYQIRGNVAGPGLHWLGSDNPSVSFEIKDLTNGGAVVPVGTSTILQSGDISTTNAGQTLLLSKSLSFTPVIARTPLLPGKTTAMATIDVWMRNH